MILLFVLSASMVLFLPIVAKHPQLEVISLLKLILCACNLSDDAGDPIAASDPVCTSPDDDAKEGSDEFLPDNGVDHGLDDRVDHGLDNMDLVRLPKIPSLTECEEEFRKQFYSNVDKRLMETRNKIPNYRPLFKTKQEALEIIVLLTAWDETGKGKRKRSPH